jgi:hypothetical protein
MSSDESRAFPETRRLGRTVGTTPHGDLTTETVEAFADELAAIESALDEAPVDAAVRLCAFWDGYVTATLDEAGVSAPGTTPGERLEGAFEADALGVDLYQALDRLYSRIGVSTEDGRTGTAVDDESGVDADAAETWARRTVTLTRQHYEHLVGHLR